MALIVHLVAVKLHTWHYQRFCCSRSAAALSKSGGAGSQLSQFVSEIGTKELFDTEEPNLWALREAGERRAAGVAAFHILGCEAREMDSDDKSVDEKPGWRSVSMR